MVSKAIDILQFLFYDRRFSGINTTTRIDTYQLALLYGLVGITVFNQVDRFIIDRIFVPKNEQLLSSHGHSSLGPRCTPYIVAFRVTSLAQ